MAGKCNPKTIKRKIRLWKLIVIAGVIPLAFIGIACQDQLADAVRQVEQLADRDATLEAGPAALDAPGALVKPLRIGQGRVEAGFLELLLRHRCPSFAM